VTILGLISWYFLSTNTSKNNFSPKEKIWKTAEVKIAKDFASIKVPAKVKSNQFAIIAPRRVGIIQDLLVDIGDEVEKGQTIGSMLPEGVEGQSSAAIAEASARLQKARAELSRAKGVAVEAVEVATEQWKETNFQYQTRTTLDQESRKQLEEKRLEAILIATQIWENSKLVLFGTGSNTSSRSIQGSFANTNQENDVENLADEVQRMEESGQWNLPSTVVEHLSHLENFITEAEILYKNALEARNFTKDQIIANLSTIQNEQVRISQTKQAILALEEKNKRLTAEQAEKGAGVDRSTEVIELVESQQNLSTTQAY
jgi:multidrug efflux pump subunit AcrA (membrane-fusion protein)